MWTKAGNQEFQSLNGIEKLEKLSYYVSLEMLNKFWFHGYVLALSLSLIISLSLSL